MFKRYNDALGKADDNTKKADKSTSLYEEGINKLVAVMSLGAVLKFGEQMNALGQEANISEERFRALTETMGGYEAVMQTMRAATLGVVDDMAIQQNSMLLIQSAGIETTEELGRMSEMIMRLKKPSEDATTAFQNFGLMLANNSILRLDSFGLSASRVRERIIELTESGEAADRSEAFRMAVMEEGERTIRKFGDASDAAGTAFSRFGTIVTNVQQDIAQNINAGVEGGAGLLELALGIHPTQIAESSRRAEQAAISLALDTQAVVNEVMSSTGAGLNADFMTTWIQKALEVAKTSPELTSDLNSFMTEVNQQLMAGGNFDTGQWTLASVNGNMGDVATQLLQLQAARESERAIAADVMTSQQQAADAAAEQADSAERAVSYHQMMYDLQRRYGEEVTEQLQEQARMEGQRNQLTGTMDDIVGRGLETRRGEGNPDFVTGGVAEEMRGLASEAQRTLDYMLEMDKANDELFTDDQLERAKSQADYVGGMADSADKAAEAFKNISLSELFGQEGGGTQGEMFDAIKQDLEKMQFTAEHIADVQRTFDLASGRQTGASAFFEDTLSDTIAGVAANISQELAVGMLEDFDAVMKEAVLRGMDTSQPEFLDKLNETFNTIDFDPENFNVTDFLAEFDPAAQATTTMNTEAQGFAEASTVAEGNFARTVEHVDSIGTTMATMTSKTHELKIKPVMVDIPNLIMMLLPSLAQAIQGNGGTVPGTSQRASTSGQLNDRGRDR